MAIIKKIKILILSNSKNSTFKQSRRKKTILIKSEKKFKSTSLIEMLKMKNGLKASFEDKKSKSIKDSRKKRISSKNHLPLQKDPREVKCSYSLRLRIKNQRKNKAQMS